MFYLCPETETVKRTGGADPDSTTASESDEGSADTVRRTGPAGGRVFVSVAVRDLMFFKRKRSFYGRKTENHFFGRSE